MLSKMPQTLQRFQPKKKKEKLHQGSQRVRKPIRLKRGHGTLAGAEEEALRIAWQGGSKTLLIGPTGEPPAVPALSVSHYLTPFFLREIQAHNCPNLRWLSLLVAPEPNAVISNKERKGSQCLALMVSHSLQNDIVVSSAFSFARVQRRSPPPEAGFFSTLLTLPRPCSFSLPVDRCVYRSQPPAVRPTSLHQQ